MTRHELHRRMVEIVGQIVEHYESDFYDYDVETLDKSNENNQHYFIWIPRTSGTFLIPVDNAVGMESWFDAIMQNFRSELAFYEIWHLRDDDWVMAVSNEKNVRNAFERQQHYELEVRDEYGRTMWEDIGIFDSQDLANEKVNSIKDYKGGTYCTALPVRGVKS